MGIATVANAQLQTTTSNQDGILIMDAIGRAFSAPLDENNIGPYLFYELQATSQRLDFPFPIVKDVELVGAPNGSPKGAYVIDMFGGQFVLNLDTFVTSPDDAPSDLTAPDPAGRVPALTKEGIGAFSPYDDHFKTAPYWGFDVVEDMEIAPDWREITFGFRGVFVLDSDGVVHPVGDTNLPQYAFMETPGDQSTSLYYPTLFPETLDNSGSTIPAADVLNNGPITYPVNKPWASEYINSVTPVFTYFGFGSDIARDLEISVEYVEMQIPSKTTGAIENRIIAMTNGYYILDGFGVVHTCRLPLDFDVNNDGEVTYDGDVINADGSLNSSFAQPINNTVIAAPWIEERENLPYFGGDFAVDVEITPSGKGFFLLDSYGGIHRIGDAKIQFPPTVGSDGIIYTTPQNTPYFGVPIARDLALVSNEANSDLGLRENQIATGLLVLDMFGNVHTAGLADSYDISEKGNSGSSINLFSDIFRSIETTPLIVPDAAPVDYFVVGYGATAQNVPASSAPNFRNVSVDTFTIVTSPALVTGVDPQ